MGPKINGRSPLSTNYPSGPQKAISILPLTNELVFGLGYGRKQNLTIEQLPNSSVRLRKRRRNILPGLKME